MTAANVIDNTFNAVSLYAYEKKALSEAEQLDRLFDAVNELRTVLVEHSDKLETLVQPIESITWFSDLEKEELIKISTIITLVKDTVLREKKFWAEINKKFKNSGFCSDEIKRYKHIIDDLTEATNDLQEVIFEIPHDKEFQKLNKELHLLGK
jgi:uncharacterized coiled-coil DUF342 family protein